MGRKKNIDDLIRENLSDFKQTPSPDIWERIESELYPPAITNPPKTYRTYFKYASALLVFLGSSALALIFTQQNSDSANAARGYDPVIHAAPYGTLQLRNSQANTPVLAYADDIPVHTNTIQANQVRHATQNTNTVIAEVPVSEMEDITSNSSLQNADTDIITATRDASDNASIFTNEHIERIIDNINTATESVVMSSTIPVEEDASIIAPSLNKVDKIESRYFTANTGDEEVKQSYYQDADDYSPQIHLKGISFGVAGSYNQTSVLENSNIFKGEKPIQPSLKFGTSKGVSFSYNFSNKFGIQAEYIYNSVQGQNYVLSEDENIIQKTLALYYNQIPVTLKLKVPRIAGITQKPFVTNYIAGIQYDMLSEYRVPQEKRISPPDDLFRDDAVSLVLGIDYDIYLSRQTYITLGARTSISNDISTHQYPLDDYAKHNFVFGLRAGFNYTFRNY